MEVIQKTEVGSPVMPSVYLDELLRALDHLGLPLNNNDSERGTRAVAKQRNISGSTKSEEGRKFRDGLLTIKQTRFRLGYSFWEYVQLWFQGRPLDLVELVWDCDQTAGAWALSTAMTF